MYNMSIYEASWLYMKLPGGPDGLDPPDGAGAAGVHLGGGPRIRSSSGGPDEAIDTSNVIVGALAWPVLTCVTAF